MNMYTAIKELVNCMPKLSGNNAKLTRCEWKILWQIKNTLACN